MKLKSRFAYFVAGTTFSLLCGLFFNPSAFGSAHTDPLINRFHVAADSDYSNFRTYYISSSGDDTDLGTSPDHAWKTTFQVNTTDFSPGDQILFQGNEVFEGGLLFDSNDVGNAKLPILISSYGEGRATILADQENGFWAYNTGGFKIASIDFVTADKDKNRESGINFFDDLPGNGKLEYIEIEQVNVHGFGKSGIIVGSWNGKAGYKDVLIKSVRTYDNGENGLATYAKEANAHLNISVSHVEAFDNLGILGKVNPTGNGIVLGGVNHGKIEYSLAYNNGVLNNSSSGPAGIWTYDSSYVTIQHNESHHNRTGGSVDGDGFDLDQNVSHSKLQYNYSHDNEGAGFLLSHGLENHQHTHNIVRYNVSHNDALRNSYGAIYLYGEIRNSVIHNNTVILHDSNEGTPSAFKASNQTTESLVVDKILVCNNHFETSGENIIEITTQQLSSINSIRFFSNNYYAAGRLPSIRWGTELYTGLSPWRRSTGQEELDARTMGQSFVPHHIVASNEILAGVLNRNWFNVQYLSNDSRLIDKGINLKALFNFDPGEYDFYGTPIPQGLHYDIGAYEWRKDFLSENS